MGEVVPYSKLVMLSDWAELRGLELNTVKRWNDRSDDVQFPTPEFHLGLGRYAVFHLDRLDDWHSGWVAKHKV